MVAVAGAAIDGETTGVSDREDRGLDRPRRGGLSTVVRTRTKVDCDSGTVTVPVRVPGSKLSVPPENVKSALGTVVLVGSSMTSMTCVDRRQGCGRR